MEMTTITVKTWVRDQLVAIAEAEGKSVRDALWDLLQDHKERTRLAKDTDNYERE